MSILNRDFHRSFWQENSLNIPEDSMMASENHKLIRLDFEGTPCFIWFETDSLCNSKRYTYISHKVTDFFCDRCFVSKMALRCLEG